MKKTFVLIILLTGFISSFAQPVVEFSQSRLERLAGFVEDEISNQKIPGAVTMVVHNGKLIHHEAYGLSNVNTERAMAKDDVFYIQSMTKPIITTAFMMLYEEGHFLLTDRVSKYLPEFKNLKVVVNPEEGVESELVELQREITIRDLLTHTAGFSHGLGPTELDKQVFEAQYLQEHPNIQSRVNNLMSMPLFSQPGKQWYYSASPDVISVLIEFFSGKSTADFLRERIFEPLEMNQTGYNLPGVDPRRRAAMHQVVDGKLVPGEYQTNLEGNKIWSGVNGLFSTASDYAAFCQMIINGGTLNDHTLLSPKTVELMLGDHALGLFPSPGEHFGLGFAVVNDVAKTAKPGTIGLAYWSGAYNTHFFLDPKENIIAIFFTQTDPYTSFYHQKLRQLVYQALIY